MISLVSVQWDPSRSMRTHRHVNPPIVAFRNFANAPKMAVTIKRDAQQLLINWNQSFTEDGQLSVFSEYLVYGLAVPQLMC
jgi:hypothetical protein